jgi:hypothetical protein
MIPIPERQRALIRDALMIMEKSTVADRLFCLFMHPTAGCQMLLTEQLFSLLLPMFCLTKMLISFEVVHAKT